MKDNTYIFICNNDKWNFFDNVKKEGHIEPWKCTKSVKLGDKFYIQQGYFQESPFLLSSESAERTVYRVSCPVRVSERPGGQKPSAH